MARKRCIEEITVYDITAATGYKAGLTGDWNAELGQEVVTDIQCEQYFLTNRYSSLPSKTGTDSLSAADLTSVFNYKTYADVNAAKSAVLADDYVSWIESNTDSVSYSWSNGKLKIDMMFADQSAYDTYLTGIKDNNKRSFKFTGPVTATVTS